MDNGKIVQRILNEIEKKGNTTKRPRGKNKDKTKRNKRMETRKKQIVSEIPRPDRRSPRNDNRISDNRESVPGRRTLQRISESTGKYPRGDPKNSQYVTSGQYAGQRTHGRQNSAQARGICERRPARLISRKT